MKMMTARKINLPFGLSRIDSAAAAFVFVTLLAVLVRVWAIGRESAWIDEAYSIVLSRFSLPQILTGTAADQHPPLYYFLLHFWLSLGGSVVMARMLSVILGVITVIQVMYLGTLISKNAWLGLAAGLLLALAPMNVWYSREVRMYTLMAVLTIAATTELWHGIHKGKTWRWLLYALFCSLAIYTHYFSSFVLLAHGGIVLAWAIWKKQVNLIGYWLGSMLFLVLAFLPWAATAVNQVLYHKMDWLPDPTPAVMRDTLIRVAVGVQPFFLPGLVNWLILLGLVLAIAVASVFVWKRHSSEMPAFAFVLLWAVLPVAAICSISLAYPIFQYKQFIIILAPLTLLIAWVIFLFPQKGLRAGLIGVVALVYLAGSTAQEMRLSKDDWRSVSAYISSQAQPGDLIYGNPSASSLALSLYLPETKAPTYDGYPPQYHILTGGWYNSGVLKQGQEGPLLEKAISGYRRVWLVEFVPELWDPGKYLEKWLNTHAVLLDDRTITRIRVRLYQVHD